LLPLERLVRLQLLLLLFEKKEAQQQPTQKGTFDLTTAMRDIQLSTTKARPRAKDERDEQSYQMTSDPIKTKFIQ